MNLPKIKSATKLRENLYETLKEVTQGKTYVVTHQDAGSVVLISLEHFNRMIEECDTLRSISLGVADLENGKTVSHKKALEMLRKMKSKWK